jgi:hypothetical protein
MTARVMDYRASMVDACEKSVAEHRRLIVEWVNLALALTLRPAQVVTDYRPASEMRYLARMRYGISGRVSTFICNPITQPNHAKSNFDLQEATNLPQPCCK